MCTFVRHKITLLEKEGKNETRKSRDNGLFNCFYNYTYINCFDIISLNHVL